MADTWMRAVVTWNAIYRPEWDASPEAYLSAGVVAWGRSRRLGRLARPDLGLVAYLGIQHDDPGRWGVAGAPVSRFFASCRVGQGVWLRTYPSIEAALAALHEAIDAAGEAAGRGQARG